jgi:hypothetical protein
MNISLTHINPEHFQSVTMSGCVQGIKIHLADGRLLSDVRDCSASAGSFLFNFVKEINDE